MKDQIDFEHKELNTLWQEHKEQLLEASFKYYQNSIDELKQLLKAYKSMFLKLDAQEKEKPVESLELRSFSQGILEVLSNVQASLTNYHSDKALNEYDQLLSEISKKQPGILSRKEVFKAYSLRSKANLPLFYKKLVANINLSFKTNRRKFSNVFRKLFRLDPLDVQSYRVRRIPFRNMIGFYLGDYLENKHFESLNQLFVLRGEITQKLWKFDEAFIDRLQTYLEQENQDNFSEVVQTELFDNLIKSLEIQIEETQTDLKKLTETFLLDEFQTFDRDLEIADTPDLPASNFRKNTLKQLQTKTRENNESMMGRWSNAHQALIDDWSLDVEVMLLYFSVLNEYDHLKVQISDYITENLSLNIQKLQDYIKDSYSRIEKVKSLPELRKILKEERIKNSQEFVDKMLAKTINKLSGKINQNIAYFHDKAMSFVEQVSDKRAFVKGRNYTKEIKSGEINWLSPRDLLRFEALPHFMTAIEEVEKFVSFHLEKARIKLIALGTVSDFSLESAQLMLEEKKGSLKKIQLLVDEGYNRALTHLNEAEEFMGKIKTEPLENLQTAINNFNTEIQKLKNTDNVLELQVKIVKIRAVEKSKKLRKDIWNWIVYFLPRTREFLNQQLKSTNSFIVVVKKKIGIITEKVQVSHELSDFLKKTDQSLKKLPFVYQRLYQLTPTDEDRFFVGRKTELDQLRSAYNDWENNRFITTAIIGEKGSGISSLILYFLKEIDNNLEVIHLELNYKIYEPVDYFQFFAEAFKQESFNSNEEIIQFINNRKKHCVLIIENLQHMYLKVVKGFVCQKMFFDLIASTWEKVFWVSAYTIHPWEYLEKTVHISSVFIKEIKLTKFADDTLEEIIFKRNYLSGYKIEFLASETGVTGKSYMKLDEAGKQAYLKKAFFKGLNQMSNGNVSLSQLYWLRSTQGTEEGIIKIQSLRDFDVNFDKDLSSGYLFALHAILIHDGLTLSDYAKVFNQPEYICRNDLTPMLEKGLLIKPKDKYNINPVIFRQVVDLLKSHNFIN